MTVDARRPAEVARRLGVSTATLRRWSHGAGHLLSPSAGREHASVHAAHRRYTTADMRVLLVLKQVLDEGATLTAAIAMLPERLAAQTPADEAAGAIPLETLDPSRGSEEEPSAALWPTAAQRSLMPRAAPDMALTVADTLSTLADSQQMILSGQQTVRQMLGVLLQDNFNLKEENIRLRDRMLDTERRLFELKRELDIVQTEDRERMRQMEAYLFDLQRRLDGLATPQAVRPPAAAPISRPVSPPPAAPVAAATEPAEAEKTETPPGRRGFWRRLLGQ